LTLAVLAFSEHVMAPVHGQTFRPQLQSSLTPERIETRLGVLDFRDGAPSQATLQKTYDNLDFTHALNVFLNTFQGVSMVALREGLRTIGLRDNQFVIFSEGIDSQSLLLTAGGDCVMLMGFVDLTRGPCVFESPPNCFGMINDSWWRWVIDFGAMGADRGEGGKHLILPPGYDGPVPEAGFSIARSRTNRVCILGWAYFEKDDPKPAAERIRKMAKIHLWEQGGFGTSMAAILAGKSKRGYSAPPPVTTFIEGSKRSFNCIPPNDFRLYLMIHALLQKEPADAQSPEIMGQLAAIGIVKDKPFIPDERLKKILTEAAVLGNATARSLFWNPREADAGFYYPKSAWMAPIWLSGYDFLTPPPLFSLLGVRPQPSSGARLLDARTAYFYAHYGTSPTMAITIPGMGSQTLTATLDAEKNYLDGGKLYKVNLPKGIPHGKFWSLTAYDNQTRSMLQTASRYPAVGSQNYPAPSAVPGMNGSTDVYLGPKAPKGYERNWIQTEPGKGYFVILRIENPQKAFYDKTWRPSEIEMQK
jgi:hypothetical protein